MKHPSRLKFVVNGLLFVALFACFLLARGLAQDSKPDPKSANPGDSQSESQLTALRNELVEIRKNVRAALRREILLDDKAIKSREFRAKINQGVAERLADQRKQIEVHREKRDALLRHLNTDQARADLGNTKSEQAVRNAALVQNRLPRLIVRGDDMGASHAVNEAILKCHKDGIQTAIEVIVPSPWFPEAIKMLSENPSVDVGVHLALSSEWDNIKWRPLSNGLSIRDHDGYFFPMIFPNKNYPQRSLREHDFPLREIEVELRAQIELALKLIPRTSHLSAHMGCSNVRDDVKSLVKKLAIEYRLVVDLDELGVKTVGYRGAHGTSEEKIASFIKMLESLQVGNTYLFVDHPGLDTPEMRAIHHVGYENVAVDRQGVTDAWTSPRVREAIESLGIQLIGYRDLVQ